MYKEDEVLSRMEDNDKKSIVYNEKPIQNDGHGIATCGRHVVCRLTYPNLSIDEYYNTFMYIQEKYGYSPDLAVVLWWNK